jgi:hypothetical protein
MTTDIFQKYITDGNRKFPKFQETTQEELTWIYELLPYATMDLMLKIELWVDTPDTFLEITFKID